MDHKKLTLEDLPNEVSKLNEKLDRLENFISRNLIQSQKDEILTIEQACEFLQLAKPTVYSMVSRREIPFSKKGKRLYFSKDQLIEWLKEGQSETQDQAREKAIEGMQSLHNRNQRG